MKDGSQWWNLPGPSAFVGRVIIDLMNSGVSILECPRPLAEGLLDAIGRRAADDLALDMVRFDASEIGANQSIVHELALSTGISGATIGTVSDFLNDPALADKAFCVDGIDGNMVAQWGYLLRALVEERRRQGGSSGPYLFVLMPAGLSHSIAAQLSGRMRTHKSIGLVSSIDSNAWIAAAGIRVGPGIAERLAIATVIEVAAWSREILERGVLWDTETQLTPLAVLQVLAGGRNWPFPCWENGLVDIWDDIPVPHAAAALAHGFDAEIERRIWAAQSRVLLPIFDAARRGLIAKYFDELERRASPSNPYLKQVHDRTFSYTTPWSFEWYELNKLLKNVMTSDEQGLVNDFKRSRDYLAHARVINSEALHQLSERWERVAEELTAPVPGWDWPRTGQCLSMMIGPAAGGKTTWATAQDIPVVSTDSLRIQMYGSLSVPGSQGSIFRTARATVVSLMRAGSDAILDASHLHRSDRVRNASMVPPDLSVRYVIVDRGLEDKLSAIGDRKPGLVEEHHATFLSSVSDCLEGDRLQHVKVIDMRPIG
jgi:hypothetical protein